MHRFWAACVLFLTVLLNGCQTGDSLDQAMRGYMDAIIDKNPVRLLHYFPKHSTWKFVSYDANGVASNNFFTYQQTSAKFNDENCGLYSAFFGGSDEYRYSDRVSSHPLRDWIRTKTTYRIPAKEGISYVVWRMEEGYWVIYSIGDQAP